ncbi:MAG: FAD-dependent oxidoreductase [Pseudomonadota bacterium]
MKNFETEVLICGAGAAGLTLAIDLARRGISFRLIDKMDSPFIGSRGKGIQPRSQEIFEDLGILNRLVAVGGIYPPKRQYRNDGSYAEPTMIENPNSTPAEPYHIPLLVPQFLTEAVMRERLAELGYQPQFSCELRGFEQDNEGVAVRIAHKADEEILRVRYLIGTDGGHSFVRQALKIEFPGKTLSVRSVVADVTLRGLERDAWHCFNEGTMEKLIHLCPLAGTPLFQLQAPVPLEGDVDLSADGLTNMLSERTGRNDIIVDTVSWASSYHMNARLAERYRIDRVFLAGDAAHIHPPTGGQGLNTSIQDAYNLGWKLGAVLRGAPESLLDTYEEERRPIAEGVLALSTKLLEEAKRGEMRRGREVHQLDLGYPMSSLVLDIPKRSSGLLPGDRAPDAIISGAAGLPTRLFELFKGSHWTLIGYEVDRADTVASRQNLHIHTTGLRGDIIDDRDYVRDAYGIEPGDWVLVRPDGYIGAIISSGKNIELEAYMEKVGLTL